MQKIILCQHRRINLSVDVADIMSNTLMIHPISDSGQMIRHGIIIVWNGKNSSDQKNQRQNHQNPQHHTAQRAAALYLSAILQLSAALYLSATLQLAVICNPMLSVCRAFFCTRSVFVIDAIK